MDLIQFVLTVLIMSFTAEEKWAIFFWPGTQSRIMHCINLSCLFHLLSSVTFPLSAALNLSWPCPSERAWGSHSVWSPERWVCWPFPHSWTQAVHCRQVRCPSEPHVGGRQCRRAPSPTRLTLLILPTGLSTGRCYLSLCNQLSNFGFPGGSDGKESEMVKILVKNLPMKETKV